jgi:hypothetical protein
MIDIFGMTVAEAISPVAKKEELSKAEALEFINILLNEGLCRKTRDRYNTLIEKYKKETQP